MLLYYHFIFQSEQKRFLQQHKQRSESYSKAASAMKKCRKKHKVGPKAGLAMDKEIKVTFTVLSHLQYYVIYFIFTITY